MLKSSGRSLGKYVLPFLLLNFARTYDTHDMPRIPFRFITQTVITIVTMQQTEVKEEKNRTERVYEACAMLVGQVCFLVRMLKSSGRSLGKYVLPFLLLNFAS
jgi:hypothetical protein